MPQALRHVSKLSHMTGRRRDAYERALEVLSLMRRKRLPLSAAADEAGTTPTSVRRFARGALRQVRGQWKAQPRDRLERQMLLYDAKGSYKVTVRSSTTASRIGEYHNSVRAFVATGDSSKLRRFEGKFIVDAQGRRQRFLTDPQAIKKLARARALGFESIY